VIFESKSAQKAPKTFKCAEFSNLAFLLLFYALNRDYCSSFLQNKFHF